MVGVIEGFRWGLLGKEKPGFRAHAGERVHGSSAFIRWSDIFQTNGAEHSPMSFDASVCRLAKNLGNPIG